MAPVEPALASMPILIVGEPGPDGMEALLLEAGFRALSTAAPSALPETRRMRHPDLVVITGGDVEALVKEARLSGAPVLALTTEVHAALVAGASDAFRAPYDGDEIVARVANLLEVRRLRVLLEDQKLILEDTVRSRTAELEAAQLDILERLVVAAEYRDDATREHTRRVGDTAWLLATAVASEEGLNAHNVDLIRRAAPLHDIGKIGVSDAVLLKPGSLDEDELEAVRGHTVIGARILWGSKLPLIQFSQEIALCHHERWDGSGYPAGFSGDQIPITARITAVADVFDALTHARPYKEAWTIERALAELIAIGGTHLDPRLAKSFAGLVSSGALETINWS